MSIQTITDLLKVITDGIAELRGTEDEPCFVCGDTFRDHEFPAAAEQCLVDHEHTAECEDPKPYCVVGNCPFPHHEFQSFPKQWGPNREEAAPKRPVADGAREYLIKINRVVYEAFWVRAADAEIAEKRLREILSGDRIIYYNADGTMYEPEQIGDGTDPVSEWMLDTVTYDRDDAYQQNVRDVLCIHDQPLDKNVKGECLSCRYLKMVGAIDLTQSGPQAERYYAAPDLQASPVQWYVFKSTPQAIGFIADYWPHNIPGHVMPCWWTPEEQHALTVAFDYFPYHRGDSVSFDNAMAKAVTARRRYNAPIRGCHIDYATGKVETVENFL